MLAQDFIDNCKSLVGQSYELTDCIGVVRKALGIQCKVLTGYGDQSTTRLSTGILLTAAQLFLIPPHPEPYCLRSILTQYLAGMPIDLIAIILACLLVMAW